MGLPISADYVTAGAIPNYPKPWIFASVISFVFLIVLDSDSLYLLFLGVKYMNRKIWRYPMNHTSQGANKIMVEQTSTRRQFFILKAIPSSQLQAVCMIFGGDISFLVEALIR